MESTPLDPTTTLGYLKFEGRSVDEGIIDAHSAAKALDGLDTALRFFITQENPQLADVDLPVPVRIERGSWIADIPEHAGTLVLTGFGIIAGSYLKKAAEKMAEKDFKDVGLRDVFQRSLQCLRWFIEVSKHIGHTNIRRASVVWDKTDFVGFLNDAKQVLYVPISYLKTLAAAPVTLLAEVVSVVEEERRMVVAVKEDGYLAKVEVTKSQRHIFSDEEDDDEVLFPEYVHGQIIELEGVVTRGNEMSNTIGFWHRNHVLTCRPRRGNINRHKRQLFLDCRIIGEITRLDKNGNITERRPKIIYDKLDSISDRQSTLPLIPGTADDDED